MLTALLVNIKEPTFARKMFIICSDTVHCARTILPFTTQDTALSVKGEISIFCLSEQKRENIWGYLISGGLCIVLAILLVLEVVRRATRIRGNCDP